ncbi:MAG: SGNH/GDSL hydrolase family protein [Firmicutes bacterium]|nr:SGNH/GDSL hydrolase family protein [Bacillota bacterium]
MNADFLRKLNSAAIIVIGLLFAVITFFIVKSGLSPGFILPSPNPYYSEAVNYPPPGSEKPGIIVLMWTSFAFILFNVFFGSKIRGWKKAISVVVWVLIIFCSTEYAIDNAIRKNPPLHRPHPAFLWELFPGRSGMTNTGNAVRYLSVNKYGFRYGDVQEKKPDGVTRIMVIGDSAAFGYGMNQDETFSALVEKQLNENHPGRKFEVINAAVPGYTSFSSRNFFIEKGIKFKPDILIISHNNDPDIDWDEDKNRAAPAILSPVLKVLYRSGIYMTLRREMLNRRYKSNPHLKDEVPPGQGVWRVSASDMKDNLEAVFDLCKKNNIKIVVISMPRAEEEDFPIEFYRKTMKKAADAYGGYFLDLYDQWQDTGEDDLFLDYVHPTVKGNKKLARDLTNFLETNIIK